MWAAVNPANMDLGILALMFQESYYEMNLLENQVDGNEPHIWSDS